MKTDILNQYQKIMDRAIRLADINNQESRDMERVMNAEGLYEQLKDCLLYTSTLINYVDRKWRKEYPDSYEDGNRHKSILSRAKWLCLYGVLYDLSLIHISLVNTHLFLVTFLI